MNTAMDELSEKLSQTDNPALAHCVIEEIAALNERQMADSTYMIRRTFQDGLDVDDAIAEWRSKRECR